MLPTTRRRLLTGTAAVAVSLSVIGGAVAANAATPTGTSTSGSSSSSTSGPVRLTATERTDLRRIEHALPQTFRRALREAEHHHTKTERHDALATLERRAAGGTYGDTVRTLVQDATSAGTGALPAGTVKRVQAIESGRRTDLRRDVRVFLRRALAGRYGTTLQQELEQLGNGLPAVTRHARPGAAPGSSSVSPSAPAASASPSSSSAS